MPVDLFRGQDDRKAMRVFDHFRRKPTRNLIVILITIAAGLASAADKPAEKSAGKVAPAVTSKKFEVKTTAALPTASPKLSYEKDSPLSQKPFWKAKPELLKKMADNREIVVSVHREDLPSGNVAFTMMGAGLVARSKEACFTVAQDYPKLKDVSDHFKTVSYDATTKRLFVVTQALGYEARMIMQMTPVSEDWRSEIQWEVVWGSFKGMKGVIGYEVIGPRSTEVSFNSRYEAKELPIPKFIMGFALEVVTQKVAEKMRTYLEAHAL